MVTFLRNALISFLIFTLSGCASYAPAYLPAEAPLAEEDSKPSQTDGEINTLHDENARVVKVGQEVKITTNDGENQIGAVLRISSDFIVLGNPCNYGVCETIIEVKEIAVIESRYASRAGRNPWRTPMG